MWSTRDDPHDSCFHFEKFPRCPGYLRYPGFDAKVELDEKIIAFRLFYKADGTIQVGEKLTNYWD